MLTHRALLGHLAQVGAFGVVGSDTVVLGVLPLFHVFGLNAVLGGWALAGRAVGDHGRRWTASSTWWRPSR